MRGSWSATVAGVGSSAAPICMNDQLGISPHPREHPCAEQRTASCIGLILKRTGWQLQPAHVHLILAVCVILNLKSTLALGSAPFNLFDPLAFTLVWRVLGPATCVPCQNAVHQRRQAHCHNRWEAARCIYATCVLRLFSLHVLCLQVQKRSIDCSGHHSDELWTYLLRSFIVCHVK